MNTNQPDIEIHESTYALLVRSEEKERSLLEAIAYTLLILSAAAAIWQFAHQPISFPVATTPLTTSTQVTVAAHS